MLFLSQVKPPDLLHSKVTTSDLNLLISYCYVLHLKWHKSRGVLGLLMEKDSMPLCMWARRTESCALQKHAALEIKSQNSTKSNFKASEGILAPSRIHCNAREDIALIQIKN